ncbi:MAG TPA: class I SAM-dependent methyltransferase [Gaiellaceae bacterium]
MSAELGSWESAEYVGEWLGEDVIADLLVLPRRISLALVEDAGLEVTHVVDLGSGHGPYLGEFLAAFPQARGTWVDSSPPMEDEARRQLARFGDRVTYVLSDVQELASAQIAQASVVCSSRALHHLSHDALAELYRVVGALVEPGGFVFNLDHVGAPGELEQAYRRVRGRFTGERTRTIKPHRHDYPLARADEHAAWMEAGGFEHADIPWRMLYTALIAARRRAGSASAR